MGCGNRRAFSCPYHGWSYDVKGRLVGLPQRDRYEDLEGRLGPRMGVNLDYLKDEDVGAEEPPRVVARRPPQK